MNPKLKQYAKDLAFDLLEAAMDDNEEEIMDLLYMVENDLHENPPWREPIEPVIPDPDKDPMGYALVQLYLCSMKQRQTENMETPLSSFPVKGVEIKYGSQRGEEE